MTLAVWYARPAGTSMYHQGSLCTAGQEVYYWFASRQRTVEEQGVLSDVRSGSKSSRATHLLSAHAKDAIAACTTAPSTIPSSRPISTATIQTS